MAKIYANENFPLPTVAALRKLGHDVLTTREVGNADLQIPDEEVLEFAKTTGRIVLTLNRTDFYRLHRNSPTHAGIITCTEDTDFEGLANRIHQTLESASDNLENQLIRVVRPNPSSKK
ncbi:MAG: DUF5615 family PIN-like protein [Saprospiraceae bacterium]